MLFKEFLYNHTSGVSLMLPSDIISGKIRDVSYKTNPIKLVIDADGKKFTASFYDRFVYDKIVGKQKPEKGKNIVIYLDHNKAIKYIKIK